MNRYFAKLDGDIIGIDNYIRFEAADEIEANQIAENAAEANYGQYEDPYDDQDCENYYYEVVPYDAAEHDDYFSHVKTINWVINEFQ